MSKTERVVLTEDYEHPVHGDQRVFRAGAHTLPVEIAAAARAKGIVEASAEPAPVHAARPKRAPAAAKAGKPAAKKA